MSRRDKVLASIAVLLHLAILANLYAASKHTPRLVNIRVCQK